jgi:hypothetical protein
MKATIRDKLNDNLNIRIVRLQHVHIRGQRHALLEPSQFGRLDGRQLFQLLVRYWAECRKSIFSLRESSLQC